MRTSINGIQSHPSKQRLANTFGLGSYYDPHQQYIQVHTAAEHGFVSELRGLFGYLCEYIRNNPKMYIYYELELAGLAEIFQLHTLTPENIAELHAWIANQQNAENINHIDRKSISSCTPPNFLVPYMFSPEYEYFVHYLYTIATQRRKQKNPSNYTSTIVLLSRLAFFQLQLQNVSKKSTILQSNTALKEILQQTRSLN